MHSGDVPTDFPGDFLQRTLLSFNLADLLRQRHDSLTCILTMNTSQFVTATFDAIAPPEGEPHAPAPSGTYSTGFDLNENPLSEGGKWLHTDSTLTVCKAVGGRAFGTQSGTGSYDDSN